MEYYSIEEKLQQVIYDKFEIRDLNEEERNQMNDIDDAMLYFEFLELMGMEMFETVPVIIGQPDFLQRDFKNVEREFISKFNRLVGKHEGYSCLGIDACKGKWVAVHISNNGFEVDKFSTIDEICRRYPDCDSYIIDIPIGLPESKNDLRPDLLIRKELGKKGSSIFEVPCRQAIYVEDKTEARNLNITALGKSLSEQSIAIGKAIR
jgi:hypothetical protein